MSTAFEFARLEAPAETVTIHFEETPVSMVAGENLAAGLLAAGIRDFRTSPVSGAPRGPFCMMGACYDCLVEIDGVTVQACTIRARAGLVVRRVRSTRHDER